MLVMFKLGREVKKIGGAKNAYSSFKRFKNSTLSFGAIPTCRWSSHLRIPCIFSRNRS